LEDCASHPCTGPKSEKQCIAVSQRKHFATNLKVRKKERGFGDNRDTVLRLNDMAHLPAVGIQQRLMLRFD
jgi:hypothetical protein